MQHIFRIHGLPLDMVSDWGPHFLSRFWKVFCTLIGSSASLSSGYHSQSNGQSERANQDLETTLCCLVSAEPLHLEPATSLGQKHLQHPSLLCHRSIAL